MLTAIKLSAAQLIIIIITTAAVSGCAHARPAEEFPDEPAAAPGSLNPDLGKAARRVGQEFDLALCLHHWTSGDLEAFSAWMRGAHASLTGPTVPPSPGAVAGSGA